MKLELELYEYDCSYSESFIYNFRANEWSQNKQFRLRMAALNGNYFN